MTVKMIICAVLVAAGLIFMLASLIGIAKLPDFFTRLHAQGIGDTLGAFLILAGMMAASWGGLLPVKIFLIFIVIVLTNPIGTNLMMIAAINKEDYLGYRSKMTGESSEEPAEEKPEITVSEPVDEHVPEKEPAEEAAPETETVEEQSVKAETEPLEEQSVKAETKTDNADAPARKERNRRRRNSRKKKPSEQDKPENSGDKKKPSEQDKPENSGDKKKPSEQDKPENSGDKKKPSEQDKPENSGDKKKSRKRKPKPSMRMNKAELIKAAENRGIKVPEKATKKEILDLIYAEKSGR